MARLTRIWRSNTISFASKLYKSLLSPPTFSMAMSLLTLRKGSRLLKRECLRTLFRISYSECKINDWLQSKISFPVGPHEPALATVKRRKLAWFGHVKRNDIFQDILEGGRRRSRQRKAGWTTPKSGHPYPCQNCQQWPPREDWKRISAESSVMSPRWPNRWKNWTQLKESYFGNWVMHVPCVSTWKLRTLGNCLVLDFITRKQNVQNQMFVCQTVDITNPRIKWDVPVLTYRSAIDWLTTRWTDWLTEMTECVIEWAVTKRVCGIVSGWVN